MKLLDHTKMHKPKHHERLDNMTSEPKPQITGLKMLTYAQMRKHKHTENPRCACHGIDAILAKVPEDLQGQFVRVYPRPQPRYARYPTGVSMFCEELNMEMTVPRQDSAQQPRPSLDSMVMAPVTAEGYTGTRGGAEPGQKQDERFCMPRVATVVSSFFAQARRVVRFGPALSSTPADDVPAAKDRLPNSCGAIMPEDVSKSQPSPRVTVRLQRCNAVRYRADRRQRLQPYVREDSYLGHHLGGEADSYYLSDLVAAQQTTHVPMIKQPPPAKLSRKHSTKDNPFSKVSRQRPTCHPTRPDSPFPGPQQRTKSPEKPTKKPCTHQRHDIPPVSSFQTHTHTNETTGEPHPPPLRGTQNMSSMARMPAPPPPIHRAGHLPRPNLRTLSIAPGPTVPLPLSSYRTSATTRAGVVDCVSDSNPEAVPASRRLSPCTATPASPSSDYQTGIPDDVADGIPETIAATRRFSLGEFSIAEALPRKDRLAVSDSGSEGMDAERPSSVDSSFSVGSLGGSIMSSLSGGNLPRLGYYEYAVSSVPSDPQDDEEENLNKNVTSPADTHPESDSDHPIDQSLFADFSEYLTVTGASTPSLSSDADTSSYATSASADNVALAYKDAVNPSTIANQDKDTFLSCDWDRTSRTFGW